MHLDDAHHIIAGIRQAAGDEGFAVSLAIVDASGLQVAFERMDGAVPGSIDVAIKKARTASLFQTDSAQLGQIAAPGEAVYTLENTNGGLISFGGGVVLRDAQRRVVGAVGVAGATVELDETLAQLGPRLMAREAA